MLLSVGFPTWKQHFPLSYNANTAASSFFPSPLRELKRERERADLWRGLEEHQERRMQMLTEAARNQRNLQERGERGNMAAPSSPQTAHSDQPELKPGGASSYSSGAAESAT